MKFHYKFRKYYFPLFLVILVGILLSTTPLQQRVNNLAKELNIGVLPLELSLKDVFKTEHRVSKEAFNPFKESARRYVVGHANYNGSEYAIELRNKGTFDFHRQFNRKSWRLKTPFFQQIFDKSVNFHLSRPRLSHFEDHIAYQIAALVDQPVPESRLVLLNFNGDFHGVYHLYDNMDELFLHKRNLPYAPLFSEIKLSEVKNPDEVTDVDTITLASGLEMPSPWANGFSNINKSRWQYLTLKDEQDAGEAEVLSDFLKVVFSDEENVRKEIYKYLDINKFLNWVNLQIIAGSAHTETHNIRLFYNPESDKFEFFSWDLLPFKDYMSHRYMPLSWLPIDFKPLIKLNPLPEFAEMRNQHLWQTITTKITEEVVLNHVNTMHDVLSKIYQLDPEKARLSIDIETKYTQFENEMFSLQDFEIYNFELVQWIKNRFSFLNKELSIPKVRVWASKTETSGFTHFIIEQQNESGLELAGIAKDSNQNKLTVYFDENSNQEIDSSDSLLSLNKQSQFEKTPLLLTNRKFVAYNSLKDKVVYNVVSDTFRQLPGNGQQLMKVPTYYSLFIKGFNTKRFPITIKNSVTGEIVPLEITEFEKIHDGLTWGKNYAGKLQKLFPDYQKPKPPHEEIIWDTNKNLTETFFVQKHQTLIIKPGITLSFAENTSLMVFGNIKVIGTKEKPITFTSIDPDKKWGVIAVNNAPETVVFKHTKIENTSEARIRHIPYSGGLSVYNADLEIAHCSFFNTHGDDGLNLKFGKGEVNDCLFINNHDAIDFDFATGKIENSVFQNNRNDSIDLGSAVLTVSGNTIETSGDKGVSVGGDSLLKLTKNLIHNCKIGMAIKDSSKVSFEENKLIENTLGAILFVKNRDYKLFVPTLLVNSGVIKDNKLNLWKEDKTVLVNKGGEIAPNQKKPTEIDFDWNSLYL